MKDSIVQALDRERRRLRLSIFALRQFFPKEISYRAVYRWLSEGINPLPLYRIYVQRAIAEMKRIPTPRASDPFIELRDRYRTISDALSIEEKAELLDCDPDKYEQKLETLERKYGIRATE